MWPERASPISSAADQESAAVRLLSSKDVPKQWSAMLRQVRRLRLRFQLDRLEHEIGGVDLAVRVRIAHAHDVTFVLEHEHVPHVVTGAQLAVLRLKYLQEREHFGLRQLREGEIVTRRVAHDASATGRRTIAIHRRGSGGRARRFGADAGVIIVEHVHAAVALVASPRAARVAGTEIAVRDVRRQ